MFGRVIWNKLPECTSENFEIAFVLVWQFQNFQKCWGWFIPKIARNTVNCAMLITINHVIKTWNILKLIVVVTNKAVLKYSLSNMWSKSRKNTCNRVIFYVTKNVNPFTEIFEKFQIQISNQLVEERVLHIGYVRDCWRTSIFLLLFRFSHLDGF